MTKRRRPRQQVTKTQRAGAGLPALPAGTVAVDATKLLEALTGERRAQTAALAPLPREGMPWEVPFGPGTPMVAAPINPVRTDTGRAEPRRSDYQTSHNLPGSGNKHIPWTLLRDAADSIDLFRRCIEVRKSEVKQLDWTFTIDPRAVTRTKGLKATQTGSSTPDDAKPAAQQSDSDVVSTLTAKYAAAINALVDWWDEPDPVNGLDFSAWLTALLEDYLVLDAVAIYPRQSYGGQLLALELIDGSTIKPLLDDRGARPLPPYPAYQQILRGFPRGEFTASVDSLDEVEGALQADEIIYMRENVRTWTPYGFSAVEQALVSGDLWLKRQGWMRAEYTDGAVPATWLTSDGPMDPQMLRILEQVINDELNGQTRARHRAKLLPKGVAPVETKDAAERYKPDYDEFLVKLCCSHFDVMPSQIGFNPKGGLGGKGHQDGEEDTEYRKGIKPTLRLIAKLVNTISRRYLGMPVEVTFQFLGLESEDEVQLDAVAQARVEGGRMTINEDRDRMGLPRYAFPEADMPMIVGTTGTPTFLEGSKDQADQLAEAAVEAKKNPPPPFGQPPAPGAKPGSAGPPGKSPQTRPPAAGPDAATKSELAAFVKWAKKYDGQRSSFPRPFDFTHLDSETAFDLNAARPGMAIWTADLLLKGESGGAGARGLDGLADARPADPSARTPYRPGYRWDSPVPV